MAVSDQVEQGKGTVAATVAAVAAGLDDLFRRLDLYFELPDARLVYRPSRDDAWTMAEHLEHVALVDTYLLIVIRKGVAKALRRAAAGFLLAEPTDLGRLDAIAIPDAFPWPPPLHMVPEGKTASPEVRKRLRDQWRECRELLASIVAGEGTLHTVRMSVNELGRIDMYGWLYFLVQHGRYHLRYLERLKEEADE